MRNGALGSSARGPGPAQAEPRRSGPMSPRPGARRSRWRSRFDMRGRGHRQAPARTRNGPCRPRRACTTRSQSWAGAESGCRASRGCVRPERGASKSRSTEPLPTSRSSRVPRPGTRHRRPVRHRGRPRMVDTPSARLVRPVTASSALRSCSGTSGTRSSNARNSTSGSTRTNRGASPIGRVATRRGRRAARRHRGPRRCGAGCEPLGWSSRARCG